MAQLNASDITKRGKFSFDVYTSNEENPVSSVVAPEIIQANKMFYNMLVSSANVEKRVTNVIGRHQDYLVNLNLLEDTVYNL